MSGALSAWTRRLSDWQRRPIFSSNAHKHTPTSRYLALVKACRKCSNLKSRQNLLLPVPETFPQPGAGKCLRPARSLIAEKLQGLRGSFRSRRGPSIAEQVLVILGHFVASGERTTVAVISVATYAPRSQLTSSPLSVVSELVGRSDIPTTTRYVKTRPA